MTFHQTLDAVRSLTQEDRDRLFQAMVDENLAWYPLADEQKAELDRRIADDDAHPDDGVTFEEMVAAARARHAQSRSRST